MVTTLGKLMEKERDLIASTSRNKDRCAVEITKEHKN
jgi:hypothetical protein